LIVPDHQKMSEKMDIYDYVSAQATVIFLEHRDFFDKTYQCISWAATLSPLVEFIFEQADKYIEIPQVFPEGTGEFIDQAMDGVEEYSDLKEEAEYAETVHEWLTGPDQSVDIGGPQVEKEIAEMKKLEEEHKRIQTEQADQTEKLKDQLAEKYEGSPDQEKYLEQFEIAAEAAAEALARQQAAELQKLQERQVQEQQQLHNRDR
jgi:hypothetical protein